MDFSIHDKSKSPKFKDDFFKDKNLISKIRLLEVLKVYIKCQVENGAQIIQLLIVNGLLNEKDRQIMRSHQICFKIQN